MKQEFLLSDEQLNNDLSGQYKVALQELVSLKLDLKGEYQRLLELLQQGNVETVLQIISHKKALNSIKK